MFLANFSRQNQPCTDPASRRSPHFAELPPVFHPFLPTVLIPFGKKTSATVEFLSSLFKELSGEAILMGCGDVCSASDFELFLD